MVETLTASPGGALFTLVDERLNLPQLIAVDTETTRFREPVYAWKGRTRIAPFGGHDLVLGSIGGDGGVSVYHRVALCQALWDYLDRGYHVVFHNAAFDVPVFARAEPRLGDALFQAADEGRIHDTKILEPLIQIAVGASTQSQKVLVSSPSLKALARSRAGLDLDKENGVRTSFDLYRSPHAAIPQDALRYAALDALATYLVYRSQIAEARVLASPAGCRYPLYPDRIERFGLLSENVQVRGSLSLAWLEEYPLRVDLAQARAVRERLEGECRRFEHALVSFKWAHFTPRTRVFKLKHNALRKVLAEYAIQRNLQPDLTDTGLMTLAADYWSKQIPKIKENAYAHPEEVTDLEGRLQVWLRYARARKLLATYIYPYSAAERHYPQYQNLGARTGRVSCSRPNAQNIPKRKDGIRALFVPEPGFVYLEADYRAAELVALAQVYHCLYGGSVLEEAINAGRDPHVATATRLVPEFAVLTEAEQKRWRQGAKALNFGLPGGLGAKTLQKYAATTWGFVATLEEMRALREQTLHDDPQLRAYLSEREGAEEKLRLAAKNLNLSWERFVSIFDAWNRNEPEGIATANIGLLRRRVLDWLYNSEEYEVPLPLGFKPEFDLFRTTTCTLTGRIRGRASFTEAHNTPFQGLVADAGKIALWELRRAHWSEGAGATWFPTAFIHDSILLQVRPYDVERVKELVRGCMLRGLRAVCPAIRGDVDFVGPLDRWGESTDAFGNALT